MAWVVSGYPLEDSLAFTDFEGPEATARAARKLLAEVT